MTNKDALEALDRIKNSIAPLLSSEMKDIQTIRAAIENAEVKESEIDRLKDCLRDVLKAICQKDNGVTDTIWVGEKGIIGSPIGDFIMCALDEEIDLDDLQNSPYRCKLTKEMDLQNAAVNQELLEALHFYAVSWVNNSFGSSDGEPSKSLKNDRGSIARKALAKAEAAGGD